MDERPAVDWARLRIVKGQPRSVSQATQYLPELGGCPYRYYLSRVVKAWDRPAAWLPQGLAVHEAAEYWERSGRKASLEDMLRVYYESYDSHTQRLLEDTPNAEHWFNSGRYEGPEDITRRRDIGATMVERYYDYYVNQKPHEVIWITPKGEPAIELGFSVYFGSVLVKGFIDQVITELIDDLPVDPPDIFEVMRDIKSGVKPGSIFQLATYRFAVYDEYGVDFRKGDFWMGKLGKPTKPYDLDNMSREQVTDLFERLDQGVKAEDFDPAPSTEKCGRCPVRTACMYAM